MLTDIRHRFDSLTHVYNNTESVLRQRFEIIRPPADFEQASEARKFQINAEIIEAADVVLARRDIPFLRSRDRLRKHIPYVLLLLGGAPRGMPNLRHAWRFLRTSDVLVGNCAGDVSITKAFFPNSQTALIPFPVDETLFFPLHAAAQKKARAAWGFSDSDTVLLYSGQITLEKNVHTLILMFSALQKLDSKLHLVVAGTFSDFDFEDFGVAVSGMKVWLGKLAANLGVDRKRLRFVGHKTPAQLRDLYNVADVLVNMTLHHDENFGLTQVEAMACGTPVVGTDWGGLKETIIDGITGFKVSTILTNAGVKSNWLEAAGKVLDMVRRNRVNKKMFRDCRAHALRRFSLAKYGDALGELLSQASADRIGERLEVSPFGREVWKICSREREGTAPYRRGAKSFNLYQRLIRPYTSDLGHQKHVLRETALVYLPWPISSNSALVQIHDPMFPMQIQVPWRHQRPLADVVRALADRPVLSVRKLTRMHLMHYTPAQFQAALKWMLNSGILLRVKRAGRKAGASFGGFGHTRYFYPEDFEGKNGKGPHPKLR